MAIAAATCKTCKMEFGKYRDKRYQQQVLKMDSEYVQRRTHHKRNSSTPEEQRFIEWLDLPEGKQAYAILAAGKKGDQAKKCCWMDFCSSDDCIFGCLFLLGCTIW
jgi:hypothetical protein